MLLFKNEEDDPLRLCLDENIVKRFNPGNEENVMFAASINQ